MTGSLFRSAHDALVFAFNYSGQQYGRTPVNRIAAPVTRQGKGLSGVDGAAQAGMIRSELKSLGKIPEAILTARFAQQTSQCGCGKSCCIGKRPNTEWTGAINLLADHLRDEVLKGCSTTWDMRIQYVMRQFTKRTDRVSFSELAQRNSRHIDTISNHNAAVTRFFNGETVFIEIDGKKEKRFFPGAEPRARSEIETRLVEIGMVAFGGST